MGRARKGKHKNVTVRDMGWRQIRQDLRDLSTADVEVGWFDSISPPHVSNDGSTISMAKLGAIHEFGTSTIPARPAIRGATDAHRDLIGTMFADVYTDIVDRRGVGRRGVTSRVKKIGKRFVILTRKYIRSTGPAMWPALAASTIAQKGSSKPLIDTRQLIRNVAFRVIIQGQTINGKP